MPNLASHARLMILAVFVRIGVLAAVAAGSVQMTFSLSKGITQVPITLGVMSRCPDAKLCEEVFDSVLDQVGFHKVNVTLSFIARSACSDLKSQPPVTLTMTRAAAYSLFGRLDSSDSDYGVTCMHGKQECAGNVQELCVAKHRGGGGAVEAWWPWLQCVNMGGLENIGNVGRARNCAEMSGFEWDESISGCVDGAEGVGLLKESVANSKALGIT